MSLRGLIPLGLAVAALSATVATVPSALASSVTTSLSRSAGPQTDPDATPTPTLSPSPSTTPEPSPSPTTQPPVLTAEPTQQTVAAGQEAIVSGTITVDGAPLRYARLTVLRQSGDGWTPVDKICTDGDGTWRFRARPDVTTTWLVRFATDGHAAADSPPFTVDVATKPISPLEPGPARIAAANAVDAIRSGWSSWALHDALYNQWYGSANQRQVNNSESMIKVWIAADLLMSIQGRRPHLTPYERDLIGRMIRYSDDQAAQTVYVAMGRDRVIQRLIRTCRLFNTYIGRPGWWSLTQISAVDGLRLSRCIQPGRVLFTPWANYLLGEMRNVAWSNAFGIQMAYPAGNGVRIAVKNGWTAHSRTGLWNLNCLGIWGPGNRWSLVVETRYAANLGQRYGAITCQEIARRLFR